MSLAFSSKHPYVPNLKINPLAARWIASLSDGTTVFEDLTPNEPSAWQRLSAYVKLHGLKITNLRLEAYGRRIVLVPYRDANDQPQLNGYWHSKRYDALLCDSGVFEGKACGIGYLKGSDIFITWVAENGVVQHEIRPYMTGNGAVIINDMP